MIVSPLSGFIVQIRTTEAMNLIGCRMTPWVSVNLSCFIILVGQAVPVKISHKGYPCLLYTSDAADD